jgi:uncharacterized SAM-binding protein YcdF (DUF218 family)
MEKLIHFLGYSFALPPMLFVVTALIGAALNLRWKKVGTLTMSISIAVLYLLSTPYISSHLVRVLELMAPTDTGKTNLAEAIVVFGGDVENTESGSQRVGPLTLERLFYAARTFHATHLPILVTGGPAGAGNGPLANLMADILTDDFGVPVVWRETTSLTTLENARFSARLLTASNIHTVFVITQRWHMARALWALRNSGISATSTNVPEARGLPLTQDAFLPSTKSLLDSFYAFHELIGLLYYRLRYGD